MDVDKVVQAGDMSMYRVDDEQLAIVATKILDLVSHTVPDSRGPAWREGDDHIIDTDAWNGLTEMEVNK